MNSFQPWKKGKVWALLLILAFLISCLPLSSVFATTALPRIKTCSGTPAYFCFISGTAFNPAGMNYTQTKIMNWQTLDDYGNPTTTTDESHATLLVNNYNPTNAQNFLNQMASNGYKVVRVMIDNFGAGTEQGTSNTYYGVAGPRMIGTSHVNGLYKPYMNNFLDFLNRANLNGLYVIPTLLYLPDNDYYYLGRSQKPKDAIGNLLVDNVNLLYMQQQWIDKKKAYLQNFLSYIKNANPQLLSTIFAIDLDNEVNVVPGSAPFTRTDSVTTADGGTYNMSDDIQRQQAVDANFVNWANQLVAAGHLIDSDAMFSASVFTFHAIGLDNGPNGVHNLDRYPARPDSLSQYSNLSYTDMHVYKDNNSTYTIDGDLNSSYFSSINTSTKPLYLGEFGAYTNVYSNITDAAYGMKAHKNALLQKGFKGWMFWTWDSNQSNLYNASQNGGAINGQLAPSVNGF